MPAPTTRKSTHGLCDVTKPRSAAKWERLSCRKELPRIHRKATGCEFPPTFEEENSGVAATKLEASSSKAGYINSDFPFYSYEFSGDNEKRANPSAASRSLPSTTFPRVQPLLHPKLKERSRRTPPSTQKKFSTSDVAFQLAQKTTKTGVFFYPAENMRLVLDPAIDSSSIKARNPGRLVSRRDRRLLWDSLELYGKKKREQEAGMSSLESIVTDSENEVDIGPPRKRIRRSSPTTREDDCSLIDNSYHAKLRDRTRKFRLATQHQRRREFSSSSTSSTTSETNSAQLPDGKHDHEAPFKERSRSPPNDRASTESSAASRFNREDRHNVKR
ncbi:hypothetical protein BKA64DRAFT_717919 [Cadophora sp. MPI-SDFR-AT-0126]|nr:hypothetical protein BKA64DRAFT_717919 [Leotiomycetes sp. MPI-SDFR-AT-0126]